MGKKAQTESAIIHLQSPLPHQGPEKSYSSTSNDLTFLPSPGLARFIINPRTTKLPSKCVLSELCAWDKPIADLHAGLG